MDNSTAVMLMEDALTELSLQEAIEVLFNFHRYEDIAQMVDEVSEYIGE